jgi:hypothetical protein
VLTAVASCARRGAPCVAQKDRFIIIASYATLEILLGL